MAKKSSGRQKNKVKSFPIETTDPKGDKRIEDAEVVVEDVAETAKETVSETVDEFTEDLIEPSTDTTDVPFNEPEPVPDEAPENVEETITSETDLVPVATEPPKKSGFFPLVFGGALAGLIGYGVAWYQAGQGGEDFAATIAVQADEIAELKAEISGLAERPDASEVIEQVGTIETGLTDLTSRIDSEFATLDERVGVIERQPSADGTLQETALAAYEEDIAALRAQIAEQQEEMTGMLSATREEAQAIEENALATARAATARAALAIVQGGLETGAPIATALTDLEGALTEPLPEALTAVADGVPTLASLQQSFPEAARAALGTARSEGAGGEDAGGFGSFLRNQFDVRSVEPKEGDSVDAILSRAEAAVREGRLNDGLAETATLPEVARAALTDWTALAEQRAAALDAAATLASQLNVN